MDIEQYTPAERSLVAEALKRDVRARKDAAASLALQGDDTDAPLIMQLLREAGSLQVIAGEFDGVPSPVALSLLAALSAGPVTKAETQSEEIQVPGVNAPESKPDAVELEDEEGNTKFVLAPDAVDAALGAMAVGDGFEEPSPEDSRTSDLNAATPFPG